MSWNRQYRPRTIADLHIQSVRDYFLTLLTSDTFPQVFLFTGPKGTGKTSTARIIGALLNDPANADSVKSLFFNTSNKSKPLQEPNSEAPELAVIFSGQSYLVQEIDAASNRGIDDIRSLKDQVQLPPVQGLISVYILDEVHMLTPEAFNALLKLLEEPPSHVVFILATTEFQKVPATVVSRCQVVQFTVASETELIEAMQRITAAEKLKFGANMLKYIATQANGSFRDAIKLLEFATTVKATTLEDLQQKLGTQYTLIIPDLVSAVIAKNVARTMELFQDLRDKGTNEAQFHKDLINYLHQQLLVSAGVVSGNSHIPFEAARFLLQEISSSELSQPSPLSFLRLELKFIDVIERALKKSKPSETSTPAPTIKSAKKIETPKKAQTVTQHERAAADLPETTAVSRAVDTPEDTEFLSGDGESLYQNWQHFVSQVAQTNFSLATLLKSAHPISGETGKITLSVFYKFHQEQLLQPKFTQQLNSLISLTYGGPVQINCILSQQPTEAELREPDVSSLEKLATDTLM